MECGIAEQAFQYLHLGLGIHVRVRPGTGNERRKEGRMADRQAGREKDGEKGFDAMRCSARAES